MNILLTGASGFIGRHLLGALLNSGHHVIACARHPARLRLQSTAIHYLPLDFTRACTVENWLPHLQHVDIVINAVGIIQESGKQTFTALHRDAPAALFEASTRAGVKQVIQISALAADNAPLSAYHRSKYAADMVLSQQALDWFIFRPSIVYGEGAKSMALFSAIASLPVLPVINAGQQSLQPVAIDDLVAAILRCLEPDTDVRPAKIIAAVGASPVTYISLLQQLRHWLGKAQAPVLSISLALALPLSRLGKWLGEATINPATLHMLEAGNTAPVKDFQQHLGRRPQALDEYLIRHPASQAQRWYSRLYFLRPLLRWSLAILWIWTGIVSAFLYPQAASYALLQTTGISGVLLPVMLYGAALLDLLSGLALLLQKAIHAVLYLQIALIVLYTMVITLALPEYWFHPYGPVSKNLPLLIATLIMLAMEDNA